MKRRKDSNENPIYTDLSDDDSNDAFPVAEAAPPARPAPGAASSVEFELKLAADLRIAFAEPAPGSASATPEERLFLAEEEVEQQPVWQPSAVQLSSLGWLRSMATIAWESVRHPLSTSVIDLMTGRVMTRY